jgi:trehalose synthase
MRRAGGVYVYEVPVRPLDLERLETVVGRDRIAAFHAAARAARELLGDRVVVNVNSTATGGGVAEMLQTLLAYVLGAGIKTRWSVIAGAPEFFAVTKRIHNGVYGSSGDGGPLGAAEHALYQTTLDAEARCLVPTVRRGDVVLLHDPQTAGLARPLRAVGARVIWRCHIGRDTPNGHADRSWSFLQPYLDGVADAFVFSRRAFAPRWMDGRPLAVIPPSVDPFSTKNADLTPGEVRRVLALAGLLDLPRDVAPVPFVRRDGRPAQLERRMETLLTGPPPPADVPLVVQVSRWDAMKDMAGVMQAFAEHVGPRSPTAQLALVGPEVRGVSDDPEGELVLDDCLGHWRALPAAVRARVHLGCVPMDDADENALVINALQRHAAIVTQKSLAEGFGLTVAEAMFKGRPVVASAVGGIADQIVHGESGLLVDDPADLAGFGAAICSLLDDPAGAARIGRAARERVIAEFLADRHLERYGELLAAVL